jgi:hypothetical protein
MKLTAAIVAIVLVLAAQGSASAAPFGFDAEAPGAAPGGWRCGVTGAGEPHWQVQRDASAPSAPHVLRQSGRGEFPWCVRPDAALAEGFVEVRFKPEAGRDDQAGGLVWRWRDGNTYYVARANALENNVALYRTEAGVRHTIRYVDAPVRANTWHLLRVQFTGRRIVVMLDGKTAIDLEDDRLTGPGAVGVWTKADSVTAFDDFSFGPTASR